MVGEEEYFVVMISHTVMIMLTTKFMVATFVRIPGMAVVTTEGVLVNLTITMKMFHHFC